jgi:hypothetical protein
MIYYETENYLIDQLDKNTYLLTDLTKQVPTPHYYKTMNAVKKKVASIEAKATK